MQDKNKYERALPTGSWLIQERQRLGKTPADVAQAVQRHITTVRALEQNNRVIPPGWCQDLLKLGMQVPEPVWPVQPRPYCGADLHDDLQTRVGFRNSRYWLSKQLCVTEEAVTEVIQNNLIVPPSWLLKLAELGANVPPSVRMALYRSTRGNRDVEAAVPRVPTAAQAAGLSPREALLAKVLRDAAEEMVKAQATAPAGHDLRSSGWVGPQQAERLTILEEENSDKTEADTKVPAPAPAPTSAPAPVPTSAQRERASVYMNWTEDRGLYFSMSAALLEQIPSVLKELLILLSQVGQHSAKPGQGAPTSRI